MSSQEHRQDPQAKAAPAEGVRVEASGAGQGGAPGNRRGNGYAARVIGRAKEIREANAFEMRNEAKITAARIKADMRASSRRNTIVMCVLTLVTLIVLGFSLLLPFIDVKYAGDLLGVVYDPTSVIECWKTWFYVTIGPLFDSSIKTQTPSILAALSASIPGVEYDTVITRGAASLAIIACGCLLAVSGLLFQATFRNPLATPSMMGVTEGVTLGMIIYMVMGNSAMGNNPTLYFALVYISGVATLVFVLFGSRFISGGATYNVFDMLLVGTVVVQILSGFNNYYTNFLIDSTTWDYFYDLSQCYDTLREPVSYLVVAVGFVVTVLPAFLLRFRLNLVSFDDDEARMDGARPGVLRGVALVLGSIMQLVAVSAVGQVAMLSLVVPFLVRYLLPSDMRLQMVGNILLGSIVLLICFAIQHFVCVNEVPLSIGTAVGGVMVPLFVWIVALNKRGWE